MNDHWKQATAKAATLAEALPWLMTYHGKTIVVKYGGNAMTDETLKRAFAQDIVFLRYAGFKPVVVHGGGPADLVDARPARHRVGVQGRPAGHHRGGDGRRPDGARRQGAARARRAAQRARPAGRRACPARTPGCSPPTRTNTVVDGEEVDLGLVGEVAHVRPEAVQDIVDAGRIPVISSVAPDADGVVHNVNADTAAAALAVALGAEKLLVLTDVEGLYRDWPDSTTSSARSARRRWPS